MKVDLELQKRYFDKQVGEIFNTYRQPTFEARMLWKLDTVAIRRLLSRLDYNFKGLSLLVTACGFGPDLRVWQDTGARLTLTDISETSLSLVKRYYPDAVVQYADLNQLPYDNSSFDFSVVSMGLHHLDDPVKGIKEMYRVARKGIICYEMYSMVLTSFFEQLNIQAKYEVSGNRAYRFSYAGILKAGKDLNAREIYIEPVCLYKFNLCQKVSSRILYLAEILSRIDNYIPRYLGNVAAFCFLK